MVIKVMTSIIRTYSELISIPSYEDRFNYLKLHGKVGEDTFGFDRYINQRFYRSKEWHDIRKIVISRDLGCDMAMKGFEIYGQILIHHMNPILVLDILNSTDYLLNPEYLICNTKDTHNAIHYGNVSFLKGIIKKRLPNDTCPWRK